MNTMISRSALRSLGNVEGSSGGDTGAKGTPDAPGGRPALPLSDRISLSLGLEGLVALLSQEQATQLRKDARAEQRAERDAQDAAVVRQVGAMHAKATAIRNEGKIAGWMSIGSGALSFAGAASSAGKAPDSASVASRSLSLSGKTFGEVGGSAAKIYAGSEAAHRDADATRAGADAKRAEAHAEEWASLAKQAEATVDKAHQALLSMNQARAQLLATHGVYRPI